MGEPIMTASFDCNSTVADALPHIRAIATIMSGSRERADILIEHALSRFAAPSRERFGSYGLLSELIDLARVDEANRRETVNKNEEPCMSLLHSLPFSDRLAFVLVEIVGFSPVAASHLCRKMAHEVQRSASDAAYFLSRHHDDHGRRVANSKTPEYEFRS
ncbi:hypothetical protein [Agrobacterium tumefaciens]|uniref:hypothetical protein n=1 Tax=Agrobacterium tumefaciens TaxID=358 RepID=UPI00287C8321|nr:hypothetical protein [Agrobacterium tumefaciens]MDS7595413.1 hypothetical protein [Agrobacterium tumefaciens]